MTGDTTQKFDVNVIQGKHGLDAILPVAAREGAEESAADVHVADSLRKLKREEKAAHFALLMEHLDKLLVQECKYEEKHWGSIL